jgi:hypothetical protein
MGRFGRIVILSALACALPACGKRQAASAPAPRAKAAVERPAERPSESIYDAQGRLKASAERVEWLAIPMGFRRKPDMDDRHTRFEAGDLPLEKVQEFLAPRMFTGSVEQAPYRVFYRAVMPLDAAPKAVRLNIHVSARPATHSVLLEIERLTYGDLKPLSVEQAREVLAKERRHAE